MTKIPVANFLNHGVPQLACNILTPRTEREMTFELLEIILKIPLLIHGLALTHVFQNYGL